MPTEVVAINYCDLCWKDRKNEAVGSIKSPFDDKELLVCADHGNHVDDAVKSLREIFNLATAKTERKRRKSSKSAPKNLLCKYREGDGEQCKHQSSSPAALAQHGRARHGMSMADMRAVGMEVNGA